jgi:hypothetical protein
MEKVKVPVKLSKEIKLKNGLPGTAKQIKRIKDIAIYKVSDTNYEVIKVRVTKGSHLKGIFYPERETYPSNEQWGQYAWTYIQRNHAERKFNDLLKETN